jgi:hypothetical protein
MQAPADKPAGQGQQRLHRALRLRQHARRHPPEVAAPLVEDAKAAPLVLLRGRTDGSSDAPGREPHRPRACGGRARLPGGRGRGPGAHPRHLPAGRRPRRRQRSAGGRGLNRRVEIELYRALPVGMGATRLPSLKPLLPPNPREVAMDADNSPVRLTAPPKAAPSNPPTAPRSPSSASRRRSDTAAERYELRDPFAEVTYRSEHLPEMVGQGRAAGQQPLRRGGRGRQAHADPEGRRRVAARAAAPGSARAPSGPRPRARRGARGRQGPDGQAPPRRRSRRPKQAMLRPSPRSTPRPSAPRSSPASKPR